MKYLVTVLRFIKGYVVFETEKGFIERFVNLCTRNRIHLWNVAVENNTLTACISINNFKKLRPLVKKSGVKIRIIKKSGLIFQYRHYSKRIGLAAGIVIFALFHLFMSQFVWCIDVSGNNLISKEEITESAEKLGLRQGTFKKNFNEVKAARELAASYKGRVPWLSINIKGSMAIIELREKNEIIGEIENESPCNIIADFDGIILSIDNYRGDSEVTVGNGVKKGDMLINGVIINEDFSTTYYKAKAKITALHNKCISKSNKTSAELIKPIITDNYYSLGIFGMNFPLGMNKKSENNYVFTDKRYLYINGYKLPFYIKKTTIVQLIENTNAHNKTYIHSYEKINTENYYENRNSTIVSAKEKITRKNNTYVFTGEYTLIDFIGKEKPILSDKLK